jgi:ABC-type multidrug transport system ATPase subunit
MSTRVHKSTTEVESYIVVDTNRATTKKRIGLTWNNVKYTVKQGKKSLEVLKGVSGFANPGELLAIMGTSGSGKTSLLTVLSNQIFNQSNVTLSGTIQVNGINIKEVDYAHMAKYVTQEDFLLPTISTREALMFAAELKINADKKILENRVNEVLEDLKLTKVADNLVGNHMIKGLSGGEKRRLSIGIELISEPNILILDEPTSGLDSVTADVLINLLKRQAEKNRTIIFTIHQPSTNIFNMFNRLILIIDGHIIYQGDAQASASYFGSLGYQCPELTNPPDYYMRILYIKNRHALEQDEEQKISLFINNYKSLEHSFLKEVNSDSLTHPSKFTPALKIGMFHELRVLLVRALLNAVRNPPLLAIKIVQMIGSGVLVDLIFHDLGHDSQGVQARQGVLFFLLIQFIMLGLISNSITFNMEKPLFKKEYKEGLYGVIPYYASKILSELPSQIISMIIYVLLMYFAISLNHTSAKQFFVYFGIALLCTWVGCGLGNLGGALTRNVQEANMLGPTFGAPFMMFGGFFSNSGSLSTSFSWIKYISVFSYGFEAFTINEFTDLYLDPGVPKPLETLGFTGEVWRRAGSLLLLELGVSILVLLTLKFIVVK